MKTPEGWEKSEVDKYLKSIGAYNAKPATFGYGGSGTADRLVCICGFFWSLEVKREGKGPTALQLKRMAEVQKAGGHIAWGTAKMIIATIEKWRRERGFLA